MLQEFNPNEAALIAKIQDSSVNLAAILQRTVDRALGAVRAGGYTMGDAGTVPDQLKDSIVAIARWRWLISLPQVNETLQSKYRKEAHDEGIERLTRIAEGKEAIDPVDGVTPAGSANWNSENKILGRMHPGARPSGQATGGYANPEGPEDE